jgi:nicotinate-nucleotide adenylyltransferase
MMRKIGIFGGTFDPPHFGHLLMASEVLHSLHLHEIWFMPNQNPPHKDSDVTTDSIHRLHMLQLCTEKRPGFKVQSIEFERNGPSYTYDTIILLKNQYPDCSFYFIIGADMIEFLPKWHKIDQLIEFVQFVGVKRAGFESDTEYPIIEVDAPIFEVSSTMLRERIRLGHATDYLLPDEVRGYIEENHLYGP